jgi:molybdopterin synthase catalytic subunit
VSVGRFAVVDCPIDAGALAALVGRGARDVGEGCGAVCTFTGVVRAMHKGRRVRYLEYEAFAPLATKVFGRIADEAAADWPGAVLAIHHRVGRLDIGEASVVIAAASAHRADAFSVCRYAIERIKQVAPVWKREYFEGGEEWVEGATADPDDEGARQAARERACA